MKQRITASTLFMNKIEKIVYDMVKNSPAIKFALRNIYQMFFDMLPTPQNYSINPIDAKENFFFGFHDRSPFSADEKLMLANHTTIPLRMPQAGEALELGYFDFADGKMGDFHKIAESHAWNYHKGCRLQWLDKSHIIFNTAVNGKVCANISSLDGTITRTLPAGIDTVSEDGLWATSFSYERLNILMPGYGYEGATDNGHLDSMVPAETGLSLINTQTGDTTLIASLKDLCDMVEEEDVSDYKHFVTHTEFSPDGRYISFLHRWIGNDYRRRYSRLGVYDRQTGEISFMPTTGMVSHYVWNGNGKIIAYCSVKEGDAHVMFDVRTRDYKALCLGRLNVDGHQSMVSENEFITDTYPDRHRMASLHRINIENDSYDKIAYVHSPKKFQTKDFRKHIACDLHPRVSPSGQYVCFDSVLTGVRSLCVMSLKH